MNRVKAIIKDNQILGVYDKLKLKHEKYAILFLIGVETGLRISDILQIRVLTALESPWTIRECKTTKEKVITPSVALYALLRGYIVKFGLQPDDFLIFSTNKNKGKAMNRSWVYEVIRDASRACGLEGIGTHTMRKTYAVRQFRGHRDLNRLRKELNHDSVATTMLYLIDCLE